MSEHVAREAAQQEQQQRPRDSPVDDALESLLYRPIEEESAAVNDAQPLCQNASLQLAYTPKLLASWVPQPSPCCAAASVAGALNALSRSDSSDWTAADVMPYYASMTQERVRRQRRVVQMQTQAVDDELDRFVAHVHTEVAFGGPAKLTRAVLRNAVERCLRSHPTDFPVLTCAVLPEGNGDSSGADATTADSQRANTTSVAFDIALRTHQSSGAAAQRTNALVQYLHLLDGLAKLERPVKPSTAICGNEAIVRAIDAIDASERDRLRLGRATGRLRARVLMGMRKAPPDEHERLSSSRLVAQHQVARGDSLEQRNAAWRALWRAFTRRDAVLIYHLTNHYALVFALREWRDMDSDAHADSGTELRRPLPFRPHREVLTARKGQRPRDWIPFDKVHETLCAWHGYTIMQLCIEGDTEDGDVAPQ